MYLLFEEAGAFKTGIERTATDASIQVELPSGRRVKVKTANVLLRFREPNPAQLLTEAEALAETLDIDFLWEVSPEETISFETLAEAYFGKQASAVERAAMLLKLHSAPIYFHRKGKGLFRKAPPEILQAALAGLEKKRKRQAQIDAWRTELLAGKIPPEWAPLLDQLLYAPDRNQIETQALEAAATERNTTPTRLLIDLGAVASTHDYHFGRFARELLPEEAAPPHWDEALATAWSSLPQADAPAFSIDDHTTTEIDDAFSVRRRADGGWRVGVHIAAPALSIADGTELDRWARERLSTIYMPGHKITMLPPSAIAPHTLAENQWVPALSLYFDLAPSLALERTETQLERVFIAANLRLNALEPHFNEQTLSDGLPEPFPWRDELKLLWDVATVFEAGRGKSSVQNGIVDFLFYVDWAITTEDGPGFVTLVPRPRGAPLDKLVSEWAIATNVRWGEWLRAHDVAGIYRGQPPGEKVRMSIHAEPHEGLGAPCYLWATSPLRRYVDLANQRQLLATLGHGEPLPADRLAELIPAFETRYAQYQEWQRHMERYWALRWLRQERVETTTALVQRENWVRLESAPLAVKVPSLPLLASGTRVRIAIETVDLVDLDLKVRYVATV
ncbi:ribonuclease catalytic domain-containing protein [Hydrogenophilus thermoluteolus]|uniref:Ribonuclease II n=1 Tax=Hydrogenophilus thermoluteolus TaxID=297 RepID=A0A2Z6DZV3_HYDTE|nr:RNB domain-containing ribonuclease [Hydrogenophilus thermoluteolus]BBD78057.1 ribonuclease II [Hydrogenophilus thermoluteolus]